MAAVEKIKEKRKPEDFFGHRNREVATNLAFPQKSKSLLLRQKEDTPLGGVPFFC